MNNCSCPCNSLIVWDESFFDAMPERKAEGLKSRKEKGERKMSEKNIPDKIYLEESEKPRE